MNTQKPASENFSDDQKLTLGIVFGGLAFILIGIIGYNFFPSIAISWYNNTFGLKQPCLGNLSQAELQTFSASTGTKGDTIGGTLGPAVALIGAFLTFLAFYIQIRANKQQAQQFKAQADDVAIDRFENKFYELIRLHQANVSEISISGYKDRKIEKRKAFSYMYRELRYTFFITKITYDELTENQTIQTVYNDEQLLRLAYIYFYVGIGGTSDKLSNYLIGSEFDEKLCKKIQEKIKNTLIEIQRIRSEPRIPYPKLKLDALGEAELSRSYKPFNGHLSRFGHYYRHLFQTVKFVVNQESSIASPKQKLEYLKTLRAQLSDHEQLMLYYNAISEFGKAWIDNKYFTEFKMIHNIPLPLADFGITPQKKFDKEIARKMDLFEW